MKKKFYEEIKSPRNCRFRDYGECCSEPGYFCTHDQGPTRCTNSLIFLTDCPLEDLIEKDM